MFRSSTSCCFYNETAPAEIYTLSLHDALPILDSVLIDDARTPLIISGPIPRGDDQLFTDRKSTRLNSSHVRISYAVFCLKKKNIVDALIFVWSGRICESGGESCTLPVLGLDAL